MSINFFDLGCKSSSSKEEFGLCDDSSKPTSPAYLDENRADKKNNWIAVVHNLKNMQVDFYAIDCCVMIKRPDETQAKRCDGMLYYDKTVIFVELKDRGVTGWIAKGTEQLKETIQHFRDNHLSECKNLTLEARLSNRQSPYFKNNDQIHLAKFKDETGIVLRIGTNIELE